MKTDLYCVKMGLLPLVEGARGGLTLGGSTTLGDFKLEI
jgi:hypothetical protein